MKFRKHAAYSAVTKRVLVTDNETAPGVLKKRFLKGDTTNAVLDTLISNTDKIESIKLNSETGEIEVYISTDDE